MARRDYKAVKRAARTGMKLALLIGTPCALMEAVLNGRLASAIVFSPFASAYATLTPKDAESGALVIDIGAGVTEFVSVRGTACLHSGQITVGCNHLVNDLMLGLGLSIPQSREILHRLGEFGSATWTDDKRTRMTNVAPEGTRERLVPASSIEHIIRLRLEELFTIIRMELEKEKAFPTMGAQIRLAGGGALIPGIEKLASEVFGLPVERAMARDISGPEEVCRMPQFLTPVGLLRWGRIELARSLTPPKPLKQMLRDDWRTILSTVREALHW